MVKTPQPLDFKTADARDKWIIDNADYFTVIQRKNLKTLRKELPSQAAAEEAAFEVLKADPEARLIIYAVANEMTAYVKSMTKKDWGKSHG